MAGDEPRTEPTRRQFRVCVGLVVVGVLVLCSGLFAPSLAVEVKVSAILVGGILAATFGARAAGAQRSRVSVDPKSGALDLETDYAAPKPTRRLGRALWLPRSRQPQRPPRSEGTEPDED
jgi:hypothetical protein